MSEEATVPLSEDVREAIAFVGETLGPFYLQDPVKGDAGPAFAAMAAIDVAQAAVEWPFVDEAEARCDLDLMRSGLAEGIDADGLVWEYRRLFIGPAPKPAPPWGSVYTDRECVVFGATTLELRAWMRSHGIARQTDDKTPEDHAGAHGLDRAQPAAGSRRVSAAASAHLVVALPRPADRGGRPALL